MTLEEILVDQQSLSELISGYQKNMLKTAKDKRSVGWFKTNLEQLESYWKEFYTQHKTLLRSKDQEDVMQYINDEVYSVTNAQYMLTKTTILNVLAPGRNQSSMESDQDYEDVSFEQVYKAPLPNMKLPTFSGQQLEWETFKGMFTSLVHDVPRIPPILKLQYLLASCTGEAAAFLKNVKVTGENYISVWQSMLDKYDDKLALVYANMFNVSNCPPVSKRTTEEINRVLAVARESNQAFKNLNVPPDKMGDLWLVHHTVQKLDSGTRMDWEKEVEAQEEDYPSFDSLAKFLGKYVKIIAKANPGTAKADPSSPSKVQTNKSKTSKGALAHVATPDKNASKKGIKSCALCKGQHFIAYCDRFKSIDINQRLDSVQQNKLCVNCLKRHHSSADCRSGGRCFLCHEKHHSSLHGADASNAAMHGSASAGSHQSTSTAEGAASPDRVDNRPGGVQQLLTCQTSSLQSPVLLATAVVHLQSSSGRSVIARALLDQGAEFSLVTERIVHALNLSSTPVRVPILGIGEATPGRSSSLVAMTLQSSTDPNFKITMEALVLNKLTSRIPTTSITTTVWEHIRDLRLADPDYGTPGPVDCIIGAEIYGRILLGGLRRGSPWEPIAQETTLGWVLSGSTEGTTSLVNHYSPLIVNHVSKDDSLSHSLQAFWKVEEPPSRSIHSPDDGICESLFKATFHLDPDIKRITVSLPFKSNPPVLGESRGTAVACWLRLETKFKRDPTLADLYHQFMQEYLTLGHMQEVQEEPASSHSYYIPHHGIIKLLDNKPKIRVVFNASQRTTNGLSLNDQLYAGPKLQIPVWLVITLWRFLLVAMTADIVKMFRQFLINSSDSDYQLIVYPLSSLNELAKRYQDRFPKAAPVILRKRYVDEFFFGAHTPTDAIGLRRELEELLSQASLNLAKWASNYQETLPAGTSTQLVNLEVDDEDISTLGLMWNTTSDCLRFKTQFIKLGATITKRGILSEVARLFDPLGWISPIIIRAKVLLQDLWLTKVGWDDPVQEHIEEQWRTFVDQLADLEHIQIPRYFQYFPNAHLELHGFSDASERAYASCVYLVVRSTCGSTSTLVMSKTKVAPINTISMPRLELCGAHLLARLMHEVWSSLQTEYDIAAYYWTDAQIVLHWLSDHPSKWTTFVATRTSAILELLPSIRWQHVKSGNNPADIATRGCSVAALKNSSLWWNGPPFLLDNNLSSSPVSSLSEEEVPERRTRAKFGGHVTVDNDDFTLRFSSYRRLLRVTAWCLRVSTYIKSAFQPQFTPYLTALELQKARDTLLKRIQSEYFSVEIKDLQAARILPVRSKLRALRPFLDKTGLLRVGGRLANASISYNEKHPIILPKEADLVKLIVTNAHLETLHGAQQITLNHLESQYWIIHGRSLVHSVIRSCVRCIRFSAKPQHQLMGDLPSVRINACFPFEKVGVDYAGPIQVRVSKGRGQRSYKGYLCIFVCMVTRAIHIEVVSDYTAQAFIAAFKRMVSRRGPCCQLRSDNGTTFRGADTELKLLLRDASRNADIATKLENDGTQWHFVPPGAPHFGGLWEAAVKSTKHHLRRVIGESTLTFEELTTFVYEVEACLNSRPLYARSNDPLDLAPITPGHLLIGRALITVPEPADDCALRSTKTTRWLQLTTMKNDFWRRWHVDYLSSLQQRNKWQTTTPNLEVGDIVILLQENLPPSKWLLGRIIKVYPGRDGAVRVVQLRTATTVLTRPIEKLVKLPVHHEECSSKTPPITAGGTGDVQKTASFS